MRLLMFLLLSLAFPVMAQIYKYTDADGNAGYNNQPPDGVKAQPVQGYHHSAAGVESQPPRKPEPPAKAGNPEQPHVTYEVLELTGLPVTEALRANDGTFTVNVLIKPRLQGTHLLRLWLDDQPYGQPGNVPILQLVNIDRGQHRLAVQVIDGDTVIQQKPNRDFYPATGA